MKTNRERCVEGEEKGEVQHGHLTEKETEQKYSMIARNHQGY